MELNSSRSEVPDQVPDHTARVLRPREGQRLSQVAHDQRERGRVATGCVHQLPPLELEGLLLCGLGAGAAHDENGRGRDARRLSACRRAAWPRLDASVPRLLPSRVEGSPDELRILQRDAGRVVGTLASRRHAKAELVRSRRVHGVLDRCPQLGRPWVAGRSHRGGKRIGRQPRHNFAVADGFVVAEVADAEAAVIEQIIPLGS